MWLDNKRLDMKSVKIRHKTDSKWIILGCSLTTTYTYINKCSKIFVLIKMNPKMSSSCLMKCGTDNYANEILGQKYGKVRPSNVAAKQHHLNKEIQKMLEDILSKYNLMTNLEDKLTRNSI